jgi:hypothetical protein
MSLDQQILEVLKHIELQVQRRKLHAMGKRYVPSGTVSDRANFMLPSNYDRTGLFIIADPDNAAASQVFIGFDNPAVATTGANKGLPLAPGSFIEFSNMICHCGELYAIGSTTSLGVYIYEFVPKPADDMVISRNRFETAKAQLFKRDLIARR